MNRLNTIKTIGPFGREEETIVFSIDDISDPFIFRGIIQEEGLYTFSAWIKSDDTEDLGITIAGQEDFYKYTFLDSGWVKVVITYEMEPEDLPIEFKKTGMYFMFKPQLERGGTATDYAPNPEDYSAAIEASASGIKMIVKSVYSDGSFELTDKALEVIAQNIRLTGTTTFRAALSDSVDKLRDIKDDLAESDAAKRKFITEIVGNIITTGIIKSAGAEIDKETGFTKQGTIHDLDGGSFRSKEFKVDENGRAVFRGGLMSPSGDIGGWVLSDDKFYHEDSDGFYIGAGALDGIYSFFAGATDKNGDGAKFKVGTDGKLKAVDADISGKVTSEDADIKGKISASAGDVGGWQIEENRLTHVGANGKYTGMGKNSDGQTYSFFAGASDKTGADGTFRVDHAGHMKATDAEVTGDIKANNLVAKEKINVCQTIGGAEKEALSWSAASDALELGSGFNSVRSGKPMTVKALTVGDAADGEIVAGSYRGEVYTAAGAKRVPVGSYASENQHCGSVLTRQDSSRYQVGVYGEYGTSGFSWRYINTDSSDIRLKENVHDTEIGSALDVINQMKLRSFDWKENGCHQKIGFIADELEEIDKKLSFGGGYDGDGNPSYKSVDTFYLIGYLTKAVQELNSKIEELEEKLDGK